MTLMSSIDSKDLKRRFYYIIPPSNRINVIWALSRVDALLQLSYSNDMPLINNLRWLSD